MRVNQSSNGSRTGPSMVVLVSIVAALLVLAQTAAAQATWLVESLIPEVISIRVPTTTISFELDQATYPPAQFPARYPATQPSGGVLPVQVFSNADGLWSLMLEVPDLLSDTGTTLVPASQVLYRVNGGIWLHADGNPQIVFSQEGATVGWLEIRIEFALELTGSEKAGTYLINAMVSASREPGF
ncbi:MAG TPA: hypothetical protein VFN03_07990 [Trueperaceae bacterium]|nr:hypothetical protein [Trueperaceae bacterium]